MSSYIKPKNGSILFIQSGKHLVYLVDDSFTMCFIHQSLYSINIIIYCTVCVLMLCFTKSDVIYLQSPVLVTTSVFKSAIYAIQTRHYSVTKLLITFVSGSGKVPVCSTVCFRSSIVSSNMFLSSWSFSTSSFSAVPLTSSSFEMTKGRSGAERRNGREEEQEMKEGGEGGETESKR